MATKNNVFHFSFRNAWLNAKKIIANAIYCLEIFNVIVKTPKRLTKEQRALLEKLAITMNEQPPIKKKGIFG